MTTSFIVLLIFNAAAESLPIARSFGCDLKTKTLPRVILIGEEHLTTSSVALRNRVIEDAVRGKYPAVVEPVGMRDGRRATITGAIQPWDKARVTAHFGGTPERSLLTGIESPIPYGVFFSYSFRIDQLNKSESPFVVVMNIVDFSRDLPLLSAALRNVASEAKDDVKRLGREMDKLSLDEAYAKLSNDEKIAFFEKNVRPKFTDADFERFAQLHHAAVIKIANSNYLEYFDRKALPTLESLRDKENFGCRGFNCVPTGRLKEVLTDQRDRDFAYTLADVLCERAGHHSDVVVDVGLNHLAGVRSWLDRLTAGRVRVTALRSDHAEDLPKIGAQLAGAHELAPSKNAGHPAGADK